MPIESEKSPSSAVTLPSAVVRCICVFASFVVLACALLGLGVACVAIQKFSTDSAPCPDDLQLTVFSAAGGLLFLSVVLLVIIGCKRKRLRTRRDEERLLAKVSTPPPTLKSDSPAQDSQESDVRTNLLREPDREVNHCDEAEQFALTQKSADVSYWIEQQKPMSEECFPLQTPDGAPCHEDSDTDGSEAEVTAL